MLKLDTVICVQLNTQTHSHSTKHTNIPRKNIFPLPSLFSFSNQSEPTIILLLSKAIVMKHVFASPKVRKLIPFIRYFLNQFIFLNIVWVSEKFQNDYTVYKDEIFFSTHVDSVFNYKNKVGRWNTKRGLSHKMGISGRGHFNSVVFLYSLLKHFRAVSMKPILEKKRLKKWTRGSLR